MESWIAQSLATQATRVRIPSWARKLVFAGTGLGLLEAQDFLAKCKITLNQVSLWNPILIIYSVSNKILLCYPKIDVWFSGCFMFFSFTAKLSERSKQPKCVVGLFIISKFGLWGFRKKGIPTQNINLSITQLSNLMQPWCKHIKIAWKSRGFEVC